MVSDPRQHALRRARRLVVKVGSQVLTNRAGELDPRYMRRIGDQLSTLIHRGYDVTLVSSGSIAVGRKTLRMDARPKDVGVLQAVAAVGQTGLMDRWHDVFARHSIEVAQMLLTRGDFEDRNRYLNIRNCITELHRIPALPIINENDTVAVDEIRLGDNDVLAALLTNALGADALILLSTVNGLQDAEGNVVDRVEDPVDAAHLIRSEKSTLGSGGMQTKIEAARMATEAGEPAVVADGREKDVLLRLLDGESVGTVFVPAERKLPSRRRWIGQAVRPAGTIAVDQGAARALLRNKRSLLATGISDVLGHYRKGDVVVVQDPEGREIARGLTNYDAEETRTIMGERSDRFEKLLGHRAYQEVVHRDNLVLTGRDANKAKARSPAASRNSGG
jgi:glutamate 5-kinase